MVVELKKCAVLELVDPVYEMCVGLGCLVLGERGGVRVFHLRLMIKGREGNGGDGAVKKGKGLINGMVDFSANKKNCKQLSHNFFWFQNVSLCHYLFPFTITHVSVT